MIDETTLPKAEMAGVGAVVIGRNEGARLEGCLRSLGGCAVVVYVDSASTDDSVAIARGLGADVVELDTTIPFTAARARNAGFDRLSEIVPSLRFVQFVDGDCEVIPGWIEAAVAELDAAPQVAAVCGRRIERFPEASIYNAMCNCEWNTPPGDVEACGGDAMMRAAAFRQVGRFDARQIAHEEPELCGRLRRAGFKIRRIHADMTIHDAAIYRLGQFMKRNRRAGFGMAQSLALKGSRADRQGAAILRRSILWGALLPMAIAGATVLFGWTALILLGVYPLQVARLAIKDRLKYGGNLARRLRIYALLVLSKFAEAVGAAEFLIKRLLGRRMGAIFYK